MVGVDGNPEIASRQNNTDWLNVQEGNPLLCFPAKHFRSLSTWPCHTKSSANSPPSSYALWASLTLCNGSNTISVTESKVRMEYEDCRTNLSSLIIWANQRTSKRSRNEATTRLHLIDGLFFDCFDWQHEDCVAEERVSGKYIDYAFRCPECLLVVEAKREGVYFELPTGKSKQKQSIKLFLDNFPKVYKAIEQATIYCQCHGTPYGAVCNGHQLIVFLASRTDGRPPLDGKVLVFDSLENLDQNFLLAWQCLSKSGVMSRRLSIELQDIGIAPVPDKLSRRIAGYPGFKRRNELQTDLMILGDLFIEDMVSIGLNGSEKEFLKECYCESGALSQYATISKDILRARYSAIFQDQTEVPSLVPVTTRKGLSPDFVAKSLSRRPILLVGDIGVGKTTFIKHLYQVREPEVFANALVFYIDFGHKPILEQDLRTFLQAEIVTQLLETHDIDIEERNFVHGVLHRDIEQFDKSIYGDIKETNPTEFKQKQVEYIAEKVRDKESYLAKCLNHIERGHRKQLVLFLDNVDQRSYEFQDQAFLVAASIAENWPVTVFVSIRPETFYRSRISGTIGAYHPRAFTIAPPRVDEVISRRLTYGLKLLESNKLLVSGDVRVETVKLADYIRILTHSFRNNLHLMQFLDNMVGGNIRLALTFVRQFIGSGHVDTAKILRIYEAQGSYLVPLHEFIRAVTYGDHEYYSTDISEITNLFDISTPDGTEHFLSPLLLAQLDRWSQHSTSDGFVQVSDIYAYAQGIGFNPYQIDGAIKRLLSRNLIELPTKTQGVEKLVPTSHYRITTTGSYYVRRLIRQFTYVDAMVVDTPIVDKDFRDKILDAVTITDRLARAELFCDYLDAQWQALSDQELSFSWPSVRWSVDKNIEYIMGKISIREDSPPTDEPEERNPDTPR